MEEKGKGRIVTVRKEEEGTIKMGWSGVGEEGLHEGEWKRKHGVECREERNDTYVCMYVCMCVYMLVCMEVQQFMHD